MSAETHSPRRPEGVTPRRPPHLATPGRGGGGEGGLGPGATTTSSLGVISFLKDLDRIQEQQIHFTKKLEKEKRRKNELEEQREELLREVFNLKAQTKGGVVSGADQVMYKKTIERLEKQLQMSKIKLSVSHSENLDCRHQIDSMRRDKVLYLQILNDLEHEHQEVKEKIQEAQKETNLVNDAKLRTKQEKTNIKNQMIVDMEEFSKELQAAKQNISSTQEVIIGTIRDKMEASFVAWEHSLKLGQSTTNPLYSPAFKRHTASITSPSKASSSIHKQDSQLSFDSKLSAHDNDINYLLGATGANSMEALITELQQSEEYIFSLYKNIQNSSLELEKLELENKRLETQVDEKTRTLLDVENHNRSVREDLEQHIQQIQKSITMYENSYNSNMQILGTISESLMSILRNVASDEEAMDQQLMSSGLNDRNIEIYLGIVEQRLDYLIQMSKAATKDNFTGSDFLVASKDPVLKKRLTFITPHLPTLDGQDDFDEDVDENARVAPISIPLLKDFVQKKVQKGLLKNEKNKGGD